MKLVIYPDLLLKTKLKPVEQFDSVLEEEVKEMFQVMKKENGIGLAANQVGLNKQIFIAGIPFKEEDFVRVFINPKLSLSGRVISIDEGCLSFPGITVEVPRFEHCQVSYQDLLGKNHIETYSGLISIVCQHEMDHLLGKTFIDTLPDLTRNEIIAKLSSK